MCHVWPEERTSAEELTARLKMNSIRWMCHVWPEERTSAEELTARLKMNSIRWMCHVWPEDRTSAEELTARLKINSMRECLQDIRIQEFGHLERMEENTRLSAWKAFNVSVSVPRERPRKTSNKVIRSDLKERKVSKDLAKDRNAWKSFIRNCPTHASMENRR